MKSKIQTDMTVEPVSIAGDIAISDAQEVMRNWGMRHLPVVMGEELVGIVSERDILRALSLHKSPKTEVQEIMSKSPYHVRQETPIAEVTKRMAEQKYGCAVVTDDGGQVIGIFTTVDALSLLSRLLIEPDMSDYRMLQLKEYLSRRRRAS